MYVPHIVGLYRYKTYVPTKGFRLGWSTGGHPILRYNDINLWLLFLKFKKRTTVDDYDDDSFDPETL